jgi:hypothetical protein
VDFLPSAVHLYRGKKVHAKGLYQLNGQNADAPLENSGHFIIPY